MLEVMASIEPATEFADDGRMPPGSQRRRKS
jgi:hypothetical protein